MGVDIPEYVVFNFFTNLKSHDTEINSVLFSAEACIWLATIVEIGCNLAINLYM